MHVHANQVVFVGELGEDLGGPSRELWRLFGMEVAMSLCHGPESCKTFKHNSSGLKVNTACALL